MGLFSFPLFFFPFPLIKYCHHFFGSVITCLTCCGKNKSPPPVSFRGCVDLALQASHLEKLKWKRGHFISEGREKGIVLSTIRYSSAKCLPSLHHSGWQACFFLALDMFLCQGQLPYHVVPDSSAAGPVLVDQGALRRIPKAEISGKDQFGMVVKSKAD